MTTPADGRLVAGLVSTVLSSLALAMLIGSAAEAFVAGRPLPVAAALEDFASTDTLLRALVLACLVLPAFLWPRLSVAGLAVTIVLAFGTLYGLAAARAELQGEFAFWPACARLALLYGLPAAAAALGARLLAELVRWLRARLSG